MHMYIFVINIYTYIINSRFIIGTNNIRCQDDVARLGPKVYVAQ